jgi:hypothetical protein
LSVTPGSSPGVTDKGLIPSNQSSHSSATTLESSPERKEILDSRVKPWK